LQIHGRPASVCQLPVEVGRRKFYLDRAFVEELVDVELDGAAYHGAPGQRERDLRRDSALASVGWLTLRFSHARLIDHPDGVIAEICAVLEVRRRQLGLRAV
jgi:very-short-patch-repair endonuclease